MNMCFALTDQTPSPSPYPVDATNAIQIAAFYFCQTQNSRILWLDTTYSLNTPLFFSQADKCAHTCQEEDMLLY